MKWAGYAAIAALTGSLFFVPEQAGAKVIIKEKTTYYKVGGSDGRAINKNMIKKGPKRTKLNHAIASTQAGLKFGNAKIGVRGSKCIVEDAEVILTLKYTLPKWTGRTKASPALVKAWDDFYQRLVKHEHKHGEIAKDAAHAFEREIKRLRGNVSKGCEDFGQFAAFRFKVIAGTLNTRQVAFDRREGFGLSGIARSQKRLFKTK